MSDYFEATDRLRSILHEPSQVKNTEARLTEKISSSRAEYKERTDAAKTEFSALLRAVEQTSATEIDAHIIKHQQMPYQQFLRSLYWRIVSDFVRADRGYACQSCGSATGAQVHHLAYDFPRGTEHENLAKLALLCDGCHNSQHKDSFFRDIAKLELWTPQDAQGRGLQEAALERGRAACAQAQRDRDHLITKLGEHAKVSQ